LGLCRRMISPPPRRTAYLGQNGGQIGHQRLTIGYIGPLSCRCCARACTKLAGRTQQLRHPCLHSCKDLLALRVANTGLHAFGKAMRLCGAGSATSCSVRRAEPTAPRMRSSSRALAWHSWRSLAVFRQRGRHLGSDARRSVNAGFGLRPTDEPAGCWLTRALTLHRLQCNLLREQHVANGEASFRCETPLRHRMAGWIELVNVHHRPVGDAVPRARITPDHLELTPGCPLLVLLRRISEAPSLAYRPRCVDEMAGDFGGGGGL
jgi:hypothetical protein